MHEIVKYFMLTDIYSEIDRRTLDPLKLIECGAGSTSSLLTAVRILISTGTGLSILFGPFGGEHPQIMLRLGAA